MTQTLTLYTHPMSRGRIARWMLEETGAPHEVQVVDYGPPMRTPAFLALNPMGKVPVLRHGEAVVTETAAICAYLADAFPEAGLAPDPASPERAPYYRWLFFAAGPLEAAVTGKALGFEVGEDPERRGMAGYGNLETVLDTLSGLLEGREHLAGGRFTAADLYLGAHLGWGMQFGTIPRSPVFERYWEPMAARPAWLRASAADDALLAQHPVPQG